jgi:hypothetical protein
MLRLALQTVEGAGARWPTAKRPEDLRRAVTSWRNTEGALKI